MISPGKYKARATEWGLGLTKNGGEQVAVSLTICDGEHAGESLTYFGYFTDKTTERTLESLRHLGWTGDNLAELNGLDSNEVEIVVAHEEYEGKQQVRVRWINAPGAGLALKERMDPAAALAFAKRMRGAVIAQRSKQGANPVQQRQQSAPSNQLRRPAPAGGIDDDIPFRQPFTTAI